MYQAHTISPKLLESMFLKNFHDISININRQNLKHQQLYNTMVLINSLGKRRFKMGMGNGRRETRDNASLSLKIIISKTKVITNLVLGSNISLGSFQITELASFVELEHIIRIPKYNQTCEINISIPLTSLKRKVFKCVFCE